MKEWKEKRKGRKKLEVYEKASQVSRVKKIFFFYGKWTSPQQTYHPKFYFGQFWMDTKCDDIELKKPVKCISIDLLRQIYSWILVIEYCTRTKRCVDWGGPISVKKTFERFSRGDELITNTSERFSRTNKWFQTFERFFVKFTSISMVFFVLLNITTTSQWMVFWLLLKDWRATTETLGTVSPW